MPEAVALAKETGSNMGVVLDVWHWHHSNSTVKDILDAGSPRIVHVHMSDAKASAPEDVRDNQRVMPGEGIIDLTAFFQALQKTGYADGVSPEPLGRVPNDMSAEDGAKLALERVAIPKEALDRISEIISPGSSLIVTDEPISRETAKYTDFIVVMSDEPQGGLKIRRPRSLDAWRYRQPSYRAPGGWNSPFSWW